MKNPMRLDVCPECGGNGYIEEPHNVILKCERCYGIGSVINYWRLVKIAFVVNLFLAIGLFVWIKR